MQDEFLGRLSDAHRDPRGTAVRAAGTTHDAARAAEIRRTLGFAASATIVAVVSLASVLVATWTSAAVPIA